MWYQPLDQRLLRTVLINVIGITDEVVKRKVIESVKTRRVDELALTKTHLKGTGMEGCEDGALSGMWEG